MSRRYCFLNYPLDPAAPSPPAIPSVELKPFLRLEKDGANVTTITLTSHSGTHIDVPTHVVDGGLTMTQMDAADFVFTAPGVIDLPMEDARVVQAEDLEPFIYRLKDVDLLLVRFGWGAVRKTDGVRFSQKSPGFGVESARFLREKLPALRGLGMDVPSVACIEHLDTTMAAHDELLSGDQRHFIIIEDMDLDQNLQDLSEVYVAPMMAVDLDGGPATIIGALGN